MLHILLVILKIAGIILAVIFLLLLLLLLSVLFVPVRYRLDGVKEEETLCGECKVSWLLHIFTVILKYTGGAPTFRIKIFGIPVNFNKKTKKTSRRIKKVKKKREPEPKKEESQKEETLPKQQEENIFLEEKEVKAKNSFPNPFHKITEVIGKIRSFRKSLPSKWKRLLKKISYLKENINHYLDILRAEEASLLLATLKKELIYILKHYRPRKCKGYIRFGTGDPATTGQILGVICGIQPYLSYNVQLYPDFESTIYEGRLFIKGHIRAVHVLATAWRLFRDKNRKKIMKLWKAQGGNNNGITE